MKKHTSCGTRRGEGRILIDGCVSRAGIVSGGRAWGAWGCLARNIWGRFEAGEIRLQTRRLTFQWQK